MPESLRPRLDGVLTTLVGAGLVAEDQAEPASFTPVPPDLALDSLITNRAGAVATSARSVTELASRYQEAKTLGRDEIAPCKKALTDKWNDLEETTTTPPPQWCLGRQGK